MENSLSTPCQDRLVIKWNNTVYKMSYWVHTAGRYRATSILERVYSVFFGSHQIEALIYMPDKTIVARMMTALDLKFETAMHYHDKGYESDNDYGLPPQVVRPVCIHSGFTTETFYLAEYKVTPGTISPFTPR